MTVAYALHGIPVSAPTTAGTYVVTATLTNPEYGSPPLQGLLTIARATPVVTWPKPAAIMAGTALGPAQLNATASVPGTFSYSPAGGTILGVGNRHVLS